MANTCQNNPKSFRINKFSKDNQPKADQDCRLGVHTASNQHSDRRYEFYWGYKNHVLCDVMTGFPLFEMTIPANVLDHEVAVDMLRKTDAFLSIRECYFIASVQYASPARKARRLPLQNEIPLMLKHAFWLNRVIVEADDLSAGYPLASIQTLQE